MLMSYNAKHKVQGQVWRGGAFGGGTAFKGHSDMFSSRNQGKLRKT